MPNQVVPFPQQQMVDPQSGWFWDGQQWVCGPGQPTCGPPNPPPWFAPPTSPWYPGANGGISFGNVAPINPVRGHLWWTGTVLALWDGAAWVSTTNGAIIVPPQGGTPVPPGTGSVIISSTPPGNPIAGMQWWDGSVLRVFDGAQWNIVGPGGAAGPIPTTTRVFHLVQPTNVSIGTAGWAIIQFTATPAIDTAVGWNATTHQYLPTRAGYYLFQLRGLSVAGTGVSGFALAKNDQGTIQQGTTEIVTIDLIQGPGTAQQITTFGISLMNGSTDFVRMFGYDTSAGTFYGGAYSDISAYLLP